MKSVQSIAWVVAIAIGLTGSVSADTLYVDDDAPAGGDGLNWATAYRHLQDALYTASVDPTINEIHVAGGTYTPDQDEAGIVVAGDPHATFQLTNDVTVGGGYAGIGSPDPDARDIDVYASELSGDLAGDDGPVFLEEFAMCVRGPGLPVPSGCEPADQDSDGDVDWSDLPLLLVNMNYSENSAHVITASDTADTAVLDGFTIRGGFAHASNGTDKGGGLYSQDGSATLINCGFTGNCASRVGGGAYCVGRDGGEPRFVSCAFTWNLAGDHDHPSGSGGGMFISSTDSGTTLTDCTFVANATPGTAGGLLYAGGSGTIAGCHFIDNRAEVGAGVWTTGEAETIFTDCVFEDNTAADFGGGLAVRWDGSLTFNNCLFDANEARRGGAVYGDEEDIECSFVDCVFRDNIATEEGGGVYIDQSEVSFDNCLMVGNWGMTTGGAFYVDGDHDHPMPVFRNCTITENRSAQRDPAGAGIGGTDLADFVIRNCIVWNNRNGTGSTLAAQIQGSSVDVAYSCVQGWNGSYGGIGMIGDDPLFVGPDAEDYRLAASSPSVNRGSNYVPDLPDHDLDGAPRIRQCRVDMGAYESDHVPGTFLDCNENGVDDDCDVYNGTSPDCNHNHVPDECDVLSGSSPDCNDNNIPDECDIADGTTPDCNLNLVPDECDIEAGTSDDCNGNGVPDECDIADGTSPDCNLNGTPDECDIDTGTSGDCDGNGVPDECDPDCNGNHVPDACDLTDGVSQDEDGSGVPDECESAILYVNARATGGNYGTSWQDAFRDLQRAIAVGAVPENALEEIWVASGTYRPDRGTGNRYHKFHLYDGVDLYGGFAGDESERNERDPAAQVCILSGDIGARGDDGDNSYHVVWASDAGAGTVLDGFVITGGRADGSEPYDRGAGIYNNGGSVAVRNCTVADNRAWAGGGMWNGNGASPTIATCLFTRNTSDPWAGGAINSNNSTPTVIGCTVADNHAVSAANGGGLFNPGGTEITLANCIFWSNTAVGSAHEGAQIGLGTITIDYCCVQGWTGDHGGLGNIGADPLFLDPNGPDGDPDTWEDNNYRLPFASPSVNTGDPAFDPTSRDTDLDGGPRVRCGRIDMGAYEYGLGDHNCDGVVDLADYAAWDGCFTGPEAEPYDDGCKAFDADYDSDIDLHDFAAFQWIFGP